MRNLLLLLAALGALSGPQAALAQDTIRLRAISPKANDPAVIKYIANNAASAPVALPDDPVTPRSVILSICGSIQPAYVDAFQTANANANPPRKVTLDEQISSRDSDLIWPACLYVAIYPNGYAARMRNDEVPAHVYMRLTGGGGTPMAVQGFFPGLDLQKVLKGATLSAPYVTRPVEITMDKLASDKFWLALQKEANQTPGIEAVITKIEAPKGALIVEAEDSTGCKAQSSDAPYKLKAVLRALERAKERAAQEKISLQRPRITVVDNGFFGADSRVAENQAFDGSPFPPQLFEPETGSVVAKRFVYGAQTIYPINFSNKVSPSQYSVHGTHVTGLVLGGPAFRPYHLDDRLRGKDGWADVTILNVGAGDKILLEGADQLLLNNLDGTGRIVNMSIAYNRDTLVSISNTFDDLLRTRKHLIVASAGNEYKDVADTFYPAAFGGPQSENLISVAALDDEGRYTTFSNRGDRNVDLAAPGCEIQSWIQNNDEQAARSGTSQAAPLVTFAAALLRTFSGNLDLRYIKARLVVSGSLLYPSEQKFTAFKVGLNIPRALYWFDDYVRVRRAKPAANPATDKPDATPPWESVEYIGTVSQLTGVSCHGSSPSSPRDIWSFKRGTKLDWLYVGKGNWTLTAPCEADVSKTGKLVFTPVYRITEEGMEKVPESGETFPLDKVEEVIFRSRFKPSA